MADKKKICATCGKLLKAGMITKEGKQFCDAQCHKKYKKAKNVCEFC